MPLYRKLKLFGLNRYEALAYTQIVKMGIASAKEVSRGSGVPYSRAYDILDSLEEKGWVHVESSRPRRYRAVNIENVLEEKSTEISERLENAKNALVNELLPYFSEEMSKAGVWTLRGAKPIHSKVIEVLTSCRGELDVVVPYFPRGYEREIEEAAELIKAKVEEGLKLRVIAGREAIAKVEPTPGEVRLSREQMGWLIISDSCEVVYAVLSPRGNEVGIWSNEPEMVRISRIMFNYLWEGSEEV